MSNLIIDFNLTSSRAITVPARGSAIMTFHVSWRLPPGADVVSPEQVTFSASLPEGVTATFTPCQISMTLAGGATTGTVAIRAAASAPATNGSALCALYLNRAGLPPPIAVDFKLEVEGGMGAPPTPGPVRVPDLLGMSQAVGTAISSRVGLKVAAAFVLRT